MLAKRVAQRRDGKFDRGLDGAVNENTEGFGIDVRQRPVVAVIGGAGAGDEALDEVADRGLAVERRFDAVFELCARISSGISKDRRASHKHGA